MDSLRLHEQNQVLLVGRLTRDPELRYTQKGDPMCRFDLAVNRRYKDPSTGEWKDDTTFVPVVAWREVAERCSNRLKKGSPVHVEGRLKGRQYEDKTGQKRKVLEINARRVQFLAASSPSTEPSSEPASLPAGQSAGESDAGSEPSLEEVPF